MGFATPAAAADLREPPPTAPVAQPSPRSFLSEIRVGGSIQDPSTTGALVALKIDGKKVTKVGEVELGGLPEGVVFSSDGQYVYVGNFIDGDLSILKVEGDKVTDTGKRVKLAGHPASMRVSTK